MEHGGAASAGDCITAATRDGISKTTLHRARKAAGVDTGKRGLNGKWVWTLQDSTSPHHLERGILESSEPSSCTPGTLEPSSRTPDSETPELFDNDRCAEDSTFHDTGAVESSDPDRFAGMSWHEQRAARLREIRERGDAEGSL